MAFLKQWLGTWKDLFITKLEGEEDDQVYAYL